MQCFYSKDFTYTLHPLSSLKYFYQFCNSYLFKCQYTCCIFLFSIFQATDIGLIVISRLICIHFHNQLNSKILICKKTTICSNSFLPYTDNNLHEFYQLIESCLCTISQSIVFCHFINYNFFFCTVFWKIIHEQQV